ncbi:rod shape-determining protein MreD [Oceanobacillus limi]|uniref:Rod shape-determining protein MreD n=1 Tax=Oceanobacillus limi TaxID=930131 RepID=A0A1I0GG42_9BACI|nr:rod shape-determining protein MreD [Oceanobacillus limi]SET70097.1 rod shape-determining protein MreD [Oceanobacillus limi]
MKRVILPLILFILVVLEGVAIEFLPRFLVGNGFLVTPHWVLVTLLLITTFYDLKDTYHSVVYGLIFGLLVDIVYTGTLGVYMFTYAVITYAIHGLMKVLHSNFFVAILVVAVGVALADLTIYAIYLVVGITDMVWQDYLTARMIPTVILNLIFLIVFYPLLVKLLVYLKGEHHSKNN